MHRVLLTVSEQVIYTAGPAGGAAVTVTLRNDTDTGVAATVRVMTPGGSISFPSWPGGVIAGRGGVSGGIRLAPGEIVVASSGAEGAVYAEVADAPGPAAWSVMEAGSREIPAAYVTMATPVGTVAAALEDVAGMSTSIVLPVAGCIVAMASFEIQTQAGAAASTIGVAVNINGTDYQEHQRYLSGTNDVGLGAIVSRSCSLAAGTYVVKLRFRRVAGGATPGIDNASMFVMSTTTT